MTSPFTKASLVLAAFAALPGVAHAGTGTATGSAAMNVVSQCGVTGATVDLGSFLTTQTWGDVGNVHGWSNTSTGSYGTGTRGQASLNFGSVICSAGTPYALTIEGSGYMGYSRVIFLRHNGKVAGFHPFIKKLGGVTLADTTLYFPGGGVLALPGYGGIRGVGTGTVQSLEGSTMLRFGENYANVQSTDVLGVTGTATDTLTYTLTF